MFRSIVGLIALSLVLTTELGRLHRAEAQPAGRSVPIDFVPLIDHRQHLFSSADAALVNDPPRTPRYQAPITSDDLIEMLDLAHIARAVVLSEAFWHDGPSPRSPDPYPLVRAENDWTAQQVAKYPKRLVAFCSFNPLADYALEELREFRRGLTVVLLSFGLTQPSGVTAQKESSVEGVAKDIIALERAALDRYIALDPQGYLSLYAPEVTYFDPMTERRVDGLKAMQEWLAPLKNAKVPFTARRYEMIGPKVQHYGDVALLTFNLVNYGKPPNKAEQPLSRWNSTEVYRRVDGKWVIVHSHWSFIKPDVKSPGS